MERKTLIWIGLFLGSTIGSLLPSLWGAGMFSFSSIILSAVGGIAGIWLGFKIGS
jgi:hypothetical protein